MLWFFACQPKAIDSSIGIDTAVNQETGVEDTEVMEEVDADGDGYPLWSSTLDTERADCDDDNPEVTPLTERYISAGDFLRGENNTPWSSPQRTIELSTIA